MNFKSDLDLNCYCREKGVVQIDLAVTFVTIFISLSFMFFFSYRAWGGVCLGVSNFAVSRLRRIGNYEIFELTCEYTLNRCHAGDKHHTQMWVHYWGSWDNYTCSLALNSALFHRFVCSMKNCGKTKQCESSGKPFICVFLCVLLLLWIYDV